MINNMQTVSAKLKFYIPFAMSLKDKRQVAQSLIQKSRHKFNVSISEVDTQDAHQTLTLGVAVVSCDVGHAQIMVDEIIRFMEDNTEAELTDVEII